jgi:hypothetical protein
VVVSAPRLDIRLIAAIERLDDPRRPIAETNRQIGLVAETIGLPRPSYEQVRKIVKAQRAGQRHSPEIGPVLLDVAFRVAPPEAVLDALAGTGPQRRSIRK